MSFISFSYLIAVIRISNTISNKSVKSGHSYLIPDLRGEVFTFSPLSMMLTVYKINELKIQLIKCLETVQCIINFLSYYQFNERDINSLCVKEGSYFYHFLEVMLLGATVFPELMGI